MGQIRGMTEDLDCIPDMQLAACDFDSRYRRFRKKFYHFTNSFFRHKDLLPDREKESYIKAEKWLARGEATVIPHFQPMQFINHALKKYIFL
jgi:hypothetical protein